MKIEEHYKILLDLDLNWEVESINFSHEQETVVVKLTYQSAPNYTGKGSIYDYRKPRQWRHLDTLQYKTYIEARVPRIKDKKGQIRTLDIPWAEVSQRHSYLLEKKL